MARDNDDRSSRGSGEVDAGEWAKQQQKGQWEPTSVRIPHGFEQYKLEAGTHIVDFMPYIAGDINPKADAGLKHFVREFEVHWVAGLDGKERPYVCPYASIRGKPRCEVCMFRNASGMTDPELSKKLRPSSRRLWLINDKPGDAKNKPKIFETGHYNKGMGFGEQMAVVIADNPGFWKLTGGMRVKMVATEQTYPGGKYIGLVRVDFLPRNYEYPEKILDKFPSLDDCIIQTPAKEMRKLLTQKDDEDGDGDTGSGKGASKGAAKASASTGGSAGDDGEISKGDTVTFDYKGKTLTGTVVKITEDDLASVQCDDRDKPHIVDLSELTLADDSGDDDDDDDKPAAQAKPSKGGKKPAPKEEDDDDAGDDDEEDDDEEDNEDNEDDEDDDPPAKPAKPGKKPAPKDDDDDWDEEPAKPSKPAKKPGKK